MAQTISYISKYDQQADIPSENYIEENGEWSNKIYEIQEEDYVHGGTHGYDNLPHEQLTNRTLYLKNETISINNDIKQLKSDIDLKHSIMDKQINNAQEDIINNHTYIETVEQHCNDANTQFTNDISTINNTLTDTINKLNTHTHLYASSDTAGGDANRVKVHNYDNQKIYLSGTTQADNTMFTTPVNIINNTLYVNAIKSNNGISVELEGNATTANYLKKNVDIYFYGDVTGYCRTNFNSDTLKINTTLEKQPKLTSAVYGPTNTQQNIQLMDKDTFVVPQLTINDRGIITNAVNYQFTVPNDIISGTTNAVNANDNTKLFLIGSPSQEETQHTYSYNNAYVLNGKLYSNDCEVINTRDKQNLSNKTYNGFVLGKACACDIETEIQGVNNVTDKVVTSHALFNHKHKYALADDYDGSALNVKVNELSNEESYLVFNKDTSLLKTNIQFKNKELQCNDNAISADTIKGSIVTATDVLNVPGGQIWIDTSADTVDGSLFNSNYLKQISQVQDDIQDIQNNFCRTIITDLNVPKGTLLAYTDKYVKADNQKISTCTNIALTITDVINNKVKILNFGSYDLDTDINNGKTCYVGTNGEMLFYTPSNAFVKKIGYVENNKLIFTPFSEAVWN